MRKFLVLLSVVSIIGLTACGNSDHTSGIPTVNQQSQVHPQVQGQTQQGQAPVIVQQSTQESSGIMPALIGGAVGYMLGSSNRQTEVQRNVETRVVERKVYVPSPSPAVVPKPATPTAPVFKAPTVPAPSVSPNTQPKPSFGYSSGGYSSVRQSASSYGSRYSSRNSSSSFSSSRRR